MRRFTTGAFYSGLGLFALGLGGLILQAGHSLTGVPMVGPVGCSALGFLLSMGCLGTDLQALRRALKNL